MIKIHGTADDTVVVEGSFNQEFGFGTSCDEDGFLGLSDGTLIRIKYTAVGWEDEQLAIKYY